MALHAVLDMPNTATPAGAKAYTDALVEQAKQTEDRVESMMLQQLAVAHHRMTSLHARAATAKQYEAIKLYGSAAERLLAEFRRLVIALRDYRTPVKNRSTTIIHRVEQWNQASGDQEIAYTRANDDEEGRYRNCRDTELASNPRGETDHDLHEQRERRIEESPNGCGRTPEPAT